MYTTLKDRLQAAVFLFLVAGFVVATALAEWMNRRR